MMHVLNKIKEQEIRVIIMIVIFAGILLACSSRDLALTKDVVSTSTPEDQVIDSNFIVVAEIEDNNLDIVIVTMKGQLVTRLTTNDSIDIYPALSPDGRRIAFTSVRDDEANIYVMNIDGSDETQLTKNSGNNTSPSWSPDGKLIAYTSSFDGEVDINIINIETGEVRPLVIEDLSVNFVAKQHPAWSPDGEKIAFEGVVLDQEQVDIYSVNVDGSNLISLVKSPFDDTYPSWSPDGNQLVFTSNRDGITLSTFKIYILDLSSGLVKRLTLAPAREVEQNPQWLPDGEQIIYVSAESPSVRNVVITSINGKSSQSVQIDGIKIIGFPKVMDYCCPSYNDLGN